MSADKNNGFCGYRTFKWYSLSFSDSKSELIVYCFRSKLHFIVVYTELFPNHKFKCFLQLKKVTLWNYIKTTG